ncbi:stress-induced protein YchH [Martelella alba]|uniref:Stress-induced protein YchH n=1 Tax=Martelella alba TaxID=2590451 RepID=A0ABY2SJP3_9HYPH|nr:stress-induced protein YchH [Martelella alba]TKI05585.1 stress-induced protein YchH [Martelella alba]
MKRKSALVLGNGLMGFGLFMMIAGLVCSVLNQLPHFDLNPLFANGAIMGIFVGALLWLTGARLGGHERITDRYWWIRRFDSRCRRTSHH